VTTTATQANSLHLEWRQFDGADAVESYELNYCFIVNECRDEHHSSCCTDQLRIDGSLRSYNITNSSNHIVEEDSTYNITLIAVNSVTVSEAAQPSTSNIETTRACMCAFH
jgi:hypothetical protein